jgi:hypothetical protein
MSANVFSMSPGSTIYSVAPNSGERARAFLGPNATLGGAGWPF